MIKREPAKRITLRIPRTLHSVLRSEAAAEGISSNQLCMLKLSIPYRGVTDWLRTHIPGPSPGR